MGPTAAVPLLSSQDEATRESLQEVALEHVQRLRSVDVMRLIAEEDQLKANLEKQRQRLAARMTEWVEAIPANEVQTKVAAVMDDLARWVTTSIDFRLTQLELEHVERGQARASAAVADDAAAVLTATELGNALGGVSDETVRRREAAGELFSILRPGRKRGREYPRLQAWQGIAGAPLASVLQALGTARGTVAYGFFTSTSDLLCHLTPVEVMVGRLTSDRTASEAARDLLSQPSPKRLEAVIAAAQTIAAEEAAR